MSSLRKQKNNPTVAEAMVGAISALDDLRKVQDKGQLHIDLETELIAVRVENQQLKSANNLLKERIGNLTSNLSYCHRCEEIRPIEEIDKGTGFCLSCFTDMGLREELFEPVNTRK